MIEELKQAIGVRVRVARMSQALTQEKLAALIGRTTESVSNIERGKSLPSIETLCRLSACLQVPLSSFVADVDTGKSAKRIEAEERLANLLSRMPDQDLDIAIGQLELLASRGDAAR